MSVLSEMANKAKNKEMTAVEWFSQFGPCNTGEFPQEETLNGRAYSWVFRPTAEQALPVYEFQKFQALRLVWAVEIVTELMPKGELNFSCVADLKLPKWVYCSYGGPAGRRQDHKEIAWEERYTIWEVREESLGSQVIYVELLN